MRSVAVMLKSSSCPVDRLDPSVLANVEMVVFRDFAVVLQRLLAGGFLVGGDKGQIADLQQLRRGKERHVGRIVVERVDDTALVDGDRL